VNVRAVVVVVVALATTTACSVRGSGEPRPETSPARESSDPRFADLLPPRPRELDLRNVDPCKDLLTDQQLRELDYDLGYARPPKPDHSDIHGGPDCTFASNGGTGGPSRNVRSLLGISTTEGALAWVTDPARTPDTRPDVVAIQGFFALALPNPKFPDNCKIVVDTAEGQYLEVSSARDSGEGTSAEPYCEEAEHVADMAIQTISASR
jgi:hypothetical protein